MRSTAKLSHGVALAALLATNAARADWRFTPTFDVRETYTDNVALRERSRARGQFVAEFAPGLIFTHRGGRLTVNGLYQFQSILMPGGPVAGTYRSAHFLQADARAAVIRDLFYIDAGAALAQQPISAFGPPVSSHSYASANRAEVATWRISPYLVRRFGRLATSELRYTHDSVDAGRSGLGSTVGNSVAFRLASGSAFDTVGWTLDARRQHIGDAVAQDWRSATANASLRYRLSRTWRLTGGIGYDSYDYAPLGGVTAGKAWNVGLDWSPGPRTRVQASTGRRFYGPSHALTASHRSRHTVWSVHYSDAIASTRSNFLLPATIDTATLLDDLFRPVYTDPVERRSAVQDYLRRTGLPPSLAENINFFSNRYSLQKTLRASMAYRRGGSSGVLSVFRLRRDALSVRESDSALLGNTFDTTNDKISQHGISATVHYTLSSRTSLGATADLVRSESRTTGATSSSNVLRLTARHNLSERMSGAVELRHVQGSTALLGGTRYTENAIAFTLSKRF